MKVKEIIIGRLLAGESVNGTAIARELNVSRNAVWKAVEQLRGEGYNISSENGYSLSGGNALSDAAIKSYLLSKNNLQDKSLLIKNRANENFSLDILVLDECASTNDIAKSLAEKGKNALVTSNTQNCGRGRLGRPFFSPASAGVYFSLIIRPEIPIEKAQLITAYAAVAAARAVIKLSGGDVKIKWVNDLFMGGRKICGILTEASIGVEGGNLDYAVIGIGINVRKAPVPDGLENVITSIEAETGVRIDRNELIAEIVNELLDAEKHILSGDFMRDYRIMSNIIHREVLVNNDYSAIVLGIEDDGAILLETESGVKKVGSGEISLKVKPL